MHTMIEKCRILYKGDKLAGSFYLLVSSFLLISSIGLYLFTTSLGYFYLAIGLFLFSVYAAGKGIFIMHQASRRLQFFQSKELLIPTELQEEINYTQYRIDKKVRNRTRYTRAVILSSIIAFVGLFTSEKGLISGSAIPVAFISGLEMGIGMLTEFRLREYLRILKKHQQEEIPVN